MNFLEFAVWGAYLTSMGNFLVSVGLAEQISWFYAIQGIVSIFMPTLMGIVADKWVQPQRLLSLCHLVAGCLMLACWVLGAAMPQGATPASTAGIFVALYTLSVAFYMPTLALSNTAAFSSLKRAGMDTVTDFPPVRVLGTVGFIASMWFVNCATTDGGFSLTLGESATKFQYTASQFLVSGVLSLVMSAYCLTLPACPIVKRASRKLSESLGLSAFRLFKQKRMALFFVFSALLGMSLQVTNGFATPFLTSFKGSADALIASSFAANNATLLTSISQMSEALCILTIPFFLRRYGIKTVMLMSMMAWVLRFGFFGLGSPVMPGVILFVLSCIVYGVAFDFFNVSGGIFVDSECASEVKASAQGLFMMMTNGLGATIGTLAAGQVVNHFCTSQNGYLLGNWQACWLIFSAFALVVGVLFALLFQTKKQ